MVDHIIIVGAGSTGQSLVQRLATVAPITVLDVSADALAGVDVSEPAALAAARKDSKPLAPVRHPVTRVIADGTSRLVLEDACSGSHPETVALVAATGSDRRNLEVCRVGAELGCKPLVAIVIDAAQHRTYRELGVRGIVRATLLGDVVEQALRYDGIAVASNVGLGKGDVIEIRVLSGSPAVGRRLSDLNAEGWRIAAIYRGDELVIPTGRTTIVAEDRVLLVGDPDILPHVGENLRMGLPDFPLRYGRNIVVYLPGGRDRALEAPAEVLALRTRASRLVRLHPAAEASRTEVDAGESPHEVIRAQPKQFEDHPLAGTTLEEHVAGILAHDPGLIVLRPAARTLGERLLGRGGRDSVLCNLASVPVLFPAGKPHITRVVLVAGAGDRDLRSADAAVDLARMLDVPLTVLNVDLPAYLGGPDPRQDQVVATIQQRAGLYRLRASVERRTGNPIREVTRYLEESDLCVVPRSRLRRDSFTSPDVALRIAHAARCSTLVISV